MDKRIDFFTVFWIVNLHVLSNLLNIVRTQLRMFLEGMIEKDVGGELL